MNPPLLEGWLAVCGLKREAAIWRRGDPNRRAVVGGGRSDLLAERLEEAIAAERPRGLISFGVAGALSPRLRVGGVLIAGSVITAEGGRWRCDRRRADSVDQRLAPLAVRVGWQVSRGRAAGVDQVADNEAAKRLLEPMAAIVDMESHIAARMAEAHGLPLTVVRVVSDEAHHSIPRAAVVAMRADGGVDAGAVLASLTRDPRQLPRLIRMGRNASRAFSKLEAVRRAFG